MLVPSRVLLLSPKMQNTVVNVAYVLLLLGCGKQQQPLVLL